MAADIAGLPFGEIHFDENGGFLDSEAVESFLQGLPALGLTDLFIFSHGWNNSQPMAQLLYERFFTQLSQVASTLGTPGQPRLRDAKIGAIGLYWPAMRWADEDSPTPAVAASLGGAAPPSDAKLVSDLKMVFQTPKQQRALDEMAQLLQARSGEPNDLLRFRELMNVLATQQDATEAPEDNGEQKGLLEDAPMNVFSRLGALSPRPRQEGAAALMGPVVEDLWDGAKEALRVLTYWQMKLRAGVVGQEGLGPFLVRIHNLLPALRIHLIGHSFGARLISFALAGLPDAYVGAETPVKSALLLQGAFSRYAFAAPLPFDGTRNGALAGQAAHVDGPIAVTHTLFDLAVGDAYPAASIVGRDDASALGDEMLVQWWAMGHKGASAGSVVPLTLGPVGSAYAFQAGQFANLDSNSIIKTGGPPSGAHSDIIHPEIAWATLSAAGIAGKP